MPPLPRAFGFGLLIAACSSGSGNASTSGGNVCDSYCDRLASASCPAFDRAKCVRDCEVVRAYACSGAYDAMSACVVAQPVRCESDGTPGVDMGAVTTVCMSQYRDWAKCVACVVASSDSACAACGKTQCCAENGAMYDDPSMPDFLKCRAECNTESCKSACAQAYPSLTDDAVAAAACEQQKCASVCSV